MKTALRLATPTRRFRSVQVVAAAIIAIALAVLEQTTAGRAQQTVNGAAIAQALGKSGTLMPGDVYRVGFPRSDLKVTLGGVTLAPALALGSYAAFKAEPQGTAVVGDLVLLESEIEPVMRSLEGSGFEITALHNHLRNESPHVMYLHYLGVGDAAKLAASLKAALQQSKTPLQAPAAATSQAAAPLPFEGTVERILGHTGTVNGGVLAIGIPRAETITLRGMVLPPAMGVGMVMNFQDVGQHRIATTGDFPLIAGELPAVEQALKAHGFEATALHHHMPGDMPPLYYMHFWMVDTPENIANGLKDALSHVNVKTGT
jgi:hypothetical protein